MKNLLFIHGAGNDGSVWNYLKEYLPDYYTMHTPDLPGHNNVDGQCKTIEEYSKWINDFIYRNDLDDLVLIGHSMGGAIAIKSCLDERVKALIVVSSGLRLPVSHRILTGLKENPMMTIQMIAKWSFFKGAPDYMKEEAIKMMTKNRESILNDFLACSNYSGYDFVKNINKKSLVIIGDSDVMIPREITAELATQLRSKIVTIENSGHMVQVENPKALAQAIEDFLKEL